jgi:hypothetical protein
MILTTLLNIECTVFQAELCGIGMAVDWTGSRTSGRAPPLTQSMSVDSKAALLVIAN